MYWFFFQRTKRIIEFELKDLNTVYNQNKEIEGIESAEYKYGEYDCSIQAYVEKNKHQADEELWFKIFLECEAVDETDFPLFVNWNFFILNKDKDTRKYFFKCNSY